MKLAGNIRGLIEVSGVILCGLLFMPNSPANGRLYLSNKGNLVDQCCFVQSRTLSYNNWEKLVTPRTKSTPGRGPVVQLYKNPIYHQAINKNICYTKEHKGNNPTCDQGTCEQQYTIQETMIQDTSFGSTNNIGLGDIWVESGCEFIPFEVNTAYEIEEDQSEVESAGPRNGGPAWFVRFVRG